MLYGIIVFLDILRLVAMYIQRIWKSKTNANPESRHMNFWELLKFNLCFIPSMMVLALVLYFYNVNYIQCPTTFYKYQFNYCECDLVERDYSNQPSEFQLNSFCNDRYHTENIFYLSTSILFSRYLPRYNSDQTGIKMFILCKDP